MHYKATTWMTITKMVYVPTVLVAVIQDGEDEVYNDETGEYEEGNECDGSAYTVVTKVK